jgi:hypothetical protein
LLSAAVAVEQRKVVLVGVSSSFLARAVWLRPARVAMVAIVSSRPAAEAMGRRKVVLVAARAWAWALVATPAPMAVAVAAAAPVRSTVATAAMH